MGMCAKNNERIDGKSMYYLNEIYSKSISDELKDSDLPNIEFANNNMIIPGISIIISIENVQKNTP